jgi:hypothetical protein
MAEAAPKRRWFQFSLRTLFAVVTVIAIWLGWELKTVRDRRILADWIAANGGRVFYVGHDPYAAFDFYNQQREWISPLRRHLGDQVATIVYIPQSATRDDIELISKIFPHADHHAGGSKEHPIEFK